MTPSNDQQLKKHPDTYKKIDSRVRLTGGSVRECGGWRWKFSVSH